MTPRRINTRITSRIVPTFVYPNARLMVIMWGIATSLRSLAHAAAWVRGTRHARWRTDSVSVAKQDTALIVVSKVENQMRESLQNYSGPSFTLVAGLTSVILVGTILLAGACASTPPAPTSSLDAARTAIATAEKADAGKYAATELGDARQKLAMADKAVKENSMIGARQLADESRVDAELASARTEAAKAVAVNTEMKVGADALTVEMQRAGDQR